MSFFHDVHDWLGGYPYESVSRDETVAILNDLGFFHVRSFVKKNMIARSGILGSGCDEYVFKRRGPSS